MAKKNAHPQPTRVVLADGSLAVVYVNEAGKVVGEQVALWPHAESASEGHDESKREDRRDDYGKATARRLDRPL
jgi:hypothetical protein